MSINLSESSWQKEGHENLYVNDAMNRICEKDIWLFAM